MSDPKVIASFVTALLQELFPTDPNQPNDVVTWLRKENAELKREICRIETEGHKRVVFLEQDLDYAKNCRSDEESFLKGRLAEVLEEVARYKRQVETSAAHSNSLLWDVQRLRAVLKAIRDINQEEIHDAMSSGNPWVLSVAMTHAFHKCHDLATGALLTTKSTSKLEY